MFTGNLEAKLSSEMDVSLERKGLCDIKVPNRTFGLFLNSNAV